ncbi:hypothetical protein RDI58_014829 [Solanum bulbocastanum]|uniref:Uncharacterized protein n=1 Tax=Solanum bulbocastanum TaxID=147425 RepID=A0AAN8TGM9_SOLBU
MDESQISPIDVVGKVLGKEHSGRVRCLGLGVVPSKVFKQVRPRFGGASASSSEEDSCSSQCQENHNQMMNAHNQMMNAFKAYMIMKEGMIPEQFAGFFASPSTNSSTTTLQNPRSLNGQTNPLMQPDNFLFTTSHDKYGKTLFQMGFGTGSSKAQSPTVKFNHLAENVAEPTNVVEPAIKTAVLPSLEAATTFSKTEVNATVASKATGNSRIPTEKLKCAAIFTSYTARAANFAEPIINTAMQPATDSTTTFSKSVVNETSASNELIASVNATE